jgi:Lytic transglycolase
MVPGLRFALYGQFVAAAAVVLIGCSAGSGAAHAKTPGKTYCFRGYCHRVLTIAETERLVGGNAVLVTSNYDDCTRDRFNPCGLTSSGEVFHADRADNAASPIYPDGTIVLVRHPKTQKTAVIRVNSAGPYHKNRMLDVSRATAEVLGFKKQGIASLDVRILKAPTKAEAGYKRNRVYPPVPGYLGTYASLDSATSRYASLTQPGVAIAGLLDRDRDIAPVGELKPAANGIERTWLAKALTFKGGKAELKEAKRVSTRIAKLDKTNFKGTARRKA